ncbi:Na(+)/H(+) antiporter subunit B [Nesterenkonia ebinurensis]|uniref:Na(+)/H(+) antiporter subunit B n=1 Tax=Nesterenkonia ebinurensis TaxID=2608252 RepID=UPI00123C969C|nr:Na(+)/H(+) antiporter subunit B [Nesterenkonia ebinurensis]
MISPIDITLGLAVLAVAGLSLIPRSRLVFTMGFLALGIVITMVWLRLDSLDVALAEAAIGTGLLSALMVWLAIRSPEPPGAGGMQSSPRLPWLRPVIGAIAGSGLTMVMAAVWLRVDQQLPAWRQSVDQQLPDTGVEHPITGVLLAFRAYDTLLESAILMLTAAAVLALCRGGGLSTPGTHRLGVHQTSSPMPPVPSALPWAARLLAPALVLLGLWLLFAGSADSGGAFQSGAVLAAAFILLRTSQVSLGTATEHWLRPVLVGGVVIFILAGLLGPVLGLPWLSWEPGWAFVVVLIVEVLLTAGIAAGLYTLFLTLENPEGVR